MKFEINHSHKFEVYLSLDLTNEPMRQFLFTKLCNSLNQNEFTIVK